MREHCFSCNHTRFLEDSASYQPMQQRVRTVEQSSDILEALASGSPKAIPERGLTGESCRKWSYLSRTRKGELQQLAVYRDPKGNPVGVKVRPADKDKIFWIGASKGNLYGRDLWGSGKMLTIVEGEIDAITVSQAQNHQWPVVSVPNGAAEAARAVAKNLEWINSFEKVLIGFDMDKQGQAAAQEVAKILPPGKAFLVKWLEKDANAMLLKGLGDKITKCLWNAEPFRPDGVCDARFVSMEPPTVGIPWPWRALTNWTLGRRGGEVYTLGAGTGMGKSDVLYETVASTIMGYTREGDEFAPEGFALFSYESGPAKTKLEVLSKLVAKRFKIPQGHPKCMWVPEDLEHATELLDKAWDLGGRLFLMDTKGASDWERVKDLSRFLHHSEGITNFAIDPLSSLAAGEDDPRKYLDAVMADAEALSEELDSKVYIMSHLARPKEGPAHEEGGHVRSNQFRDSNAIGQFSDFLLGYERNKQAETPEERCTATIRCVKDRLLGDSDGETFQLHYDRITGTLDQAYEDVPEGEDQEE